MLAPAEDNSSDSESDNESDVSASKQVNPMSSSSLPKSQSSRRRSVVVPFGPFETGEVVSVGMLDVQEKLKKVETPHHGDKHLGDHMPSQGRVRRGSVCTAAACARRRRVVGGRCCACSS